MVLSDELNAPCDGKKTENMKYLHMYPKTSFGYFKWSEFFLERNEKSCKKEALEKNY